VLGGKDAPTAYPATEKAFEVDSDTDAGRRLKLICWRDADIYPADKQTADHCQVQFADVAFADGVWTEKSTTEKAKGSK
jgi:hypothetical protein